MPRALVLLPLLGLAACAQLSEAGRRAAVADPTSGTPTRASHDVFVLEASGGG